MKSVYITPKGNQSTCPHTRPPSLHINETASASPQPVPYRYPITNMSQPSGNPSPGKSKEHGLTPPFFRLKRKHKTTPLSSGKGKGRSEELTSPDGCDVSLMSYIVAAANQQAPKPEHYCECEICNATAADAETPVEHNDLSLMRYIQDAASGEIKFEINCQCAVCSCSNPDETGQAYFPVPRVGEPMHQPRPNISASPPHFPAEGWGDQQGPQIYIPSLRDPLSVYIPPAVDVVTTPASQPDYPAPISAVHLDPQSIDAPPIPAYLLRRLAARERANENKQEDY